MFRQNRGQVWDSCDEFLGRLSALDGQGMSNEVITACQLISALCDSRSFNQIHLWQLSQTRHPLMPMAVYLKCVRVCVCEGERERGREREKRGCVLPTFLIFCGDIYNPPDTHTHTHTHTHAPKSTWWSLRWLQNWISALLKLLCRRSSSCKKPARVSEWNFSGSSSSRVSLTASAFFHLKCFDICPSLASLTCCQLFMKPTSTAHDLHCC